MVVMFLVFFAGGGTVTNGGVLEVEPFFGMDFFLDNIRMEKGLEGELIIDGFGQPLYVLDVATRKVTEEYTVGPAPFEVGPEAQIAVARKAENEVFVLEWGILRRIGQNNQSIPLPFPRDALYTPLQYAKGMLFLPKKRLLVPYGEGTTIGRIMDFEAGEVLPLVYPALKGSRFPRAYQAAFALEEHEEEPLILAVCQYSSVLLRYNLEGELIHTQELDFPAFDAWKREEQQQPFRKQTEFFCDLEVDHSGTIWILGRKGWLYRMPPSGPVTRFSFAIPETTFEATEELVDGKVVGGAVVRKKLKKWGFMDMEVVGDYLYFSHFVDELIYRVPLPR